MNRLFPPRFGRAMVTAATLLALTACGGQDDVASAPSATAPTASASVTSATPSASPDSQATSVAASPSPEVHDITTDEAEAPVEEPTPVAPTPGRVETVTPEANPSEEVVENQAHPTAVASNEAAEAGAATAMGTPVCDYGQIHIAAAAAENAGAAGSRYITLSFINSGDAPCSMSGYPAVNYVDASGNQIGAAASHAAEWTSSGKVIAPGESATATLRETRAGLYDQQTCQPESAAGYRVTIPGTSNSLVLEFPAEACSSTSVAQLSVGQVGAQA